MSVKSVFAVIFPYFLSKLLFYANSVIVSYILPKIELDVIDKVTRKTFESLKTTKKIINTNEYIMNLKKVIESKSVYYFIVSNLIPTFLVSLGIVYYFMLSSVKMGVIVLISMIVFAYLSFYMLTNSVYMSHDNEDSINLYYDNIQDVIANYDVVITSNFIKKEMDNLDEYKKHVYDTYLKSELSVSENSFGLRLIVLSMVVLLNFISMYSYSHEQMKIENVTSICITSIIFLKYFNSLISSFRHTVGYIGKFHEIEKYFSEFKIDPETETDTLTITNADIDFSQINLKYGDKQIINNFNFKVKGKTKVCIIGEIGSGKTSLFKMICGLVNYEGTIYIDGQNLKNYSYESILNKVSYIPQHPKMFNKDIFYNITYGTNITKNEISSLLKELGVENLFDMFPQKLNTLVGKEGIHLSGGQKQLIAIIRALLQSKPIILLDEPTSSLDAKTKTTIINLLKSIKDKTLLVVTHDQSILQVFDDFIVMK